MPEPPHDPSIFSEPHMRPQPPAQPPQPPPPPPAFAQPQQRPVVPYASPGTPDARDHDINQDVSFEPVYSDHPMGQAPLQVDHTVWDEPGLSPELAGQTPAGHPTYAAWLADQQAHWSAGRSWILTFGVALIAGPMAVVGTFWGTGQSIFSVLMLIVFGPVTEELMKIAGPTLLVEMRPWVFRSSVQIMLCALCGGLAFAAIENLIYLNVYIPEPTPQIIHWRWTACVALHTSCSLIAGVGVMRAWRRCMQTRTRPKLSLTYSPLVVAIIVHGTYNAMALVLEWAHVF